MGAALATLRTDVRPLSSEDYDTITACLKLLAPFYQVTVELSEEKRVSGSKIIPMIKMLMLYLFDSMGKTGHTIAKQLGENMIIMMQNKFDSIEKNQTTLTHSTLLDPRFKAIGFYNQSNAQAAIKRLTCQCSQLFITPPVNHEEAPSTSSSSQPAPAHFEIPSTTGNVVKSKKGYRK